MLGLNYKRGFSGVLGFGIFRVWGVWSLGLRVF